MNVRPKSFIIIAASSCILVAVVGAYYLFLCERRERERLTSEIAAKVTNVDVRRAVNPVFGNEFTVDVTVAYTYEIEGEKYEQSATLTPLEAQDFVPWGLAKVFYNPAEDDTVKRGRLFPESHVCGTY